MTGARKRPKGLAPFNTMECRAKIKATNSFTGCRPTSSMGLN